MKHRILALVIAIMLLSVPTFAEMVDVPINSKTFPDDSFRKAVQTGYDINGDKVLSVTEQKNIGTLQAEERKIASVKGIELLPAIRSLELGWNKIKKIDLSGNPNLDAVSANNNGLTAIDFAYTPKMEFVNLSSNKLTTLDFSHCPKLTWLEAQDNSLNSLNISGCTKLENLIVRNNKLTSLDVAGMSALYQLCCEGNQIKCLDISGCTELLKIVKKEVAYQDGSHVSWGAEDFVIDKGTTVTANGKTIYSPEMWPFLIGDPISLAFADAGDSASTPTADLVVREATAYSDRQLKQRIGTIPAYTAVLIDMSDVLSDMGDEWTLEPDSYLKATACKVLNYGNEACYIKPAALWGKISVSPDWTYTTMPKGAKLYQRPDMASASVELKSKTDVVIISEKNGWYLIRANKDDLDPYFFVPVQ